MSKNFLIQSSSVLPPSVYSSAMPRRSASSEKIW